MTLVKAQNTLFPSVLNHFFEGEVHKNGSLLNNRFNVPSVNIQNLEDCYLIELAVPGYKKEDFHIDLKKNILEISGEIKFENEEVKENYTRREFQYGNFSRNFTLPESADTDQIEASYTDGILKVRIAKTADTVEIKKRIEIK